ncbi:MAG: LysR family transcriptional regulator [Phormidesmis sp. RL_2_1]|nr:LysR family transcriptional regulator [Phormidesmis sp. RL_2_1]
MSGKPAKKLSDKVKLSQLKALMSVVATGSFSEAALELNVSQSTVSHSIAAIEDALGVTLIHRGPQRASLTPVGDRIFNQAQQVLELVDEMGREAARARGIEGGHVRIAAFRSMASEILPEAIARLRDRHPTVHISITEFDTTRELIDTLRDGKTDFAVAELLKGEEYETLPIMADPFIALLPPGTHHSPYKSHHNQPTDSQGDSRQPTNLPSPDKPSPNKPSAGHKLEPVHQKSSPLTWEDLRKQPLITSSSDCCKIVFSYLEQARPPLAIDYLIANDSTAVSMTRQGLGITILPKLAAQPIPAEVRIAELPFTITRQLGVSWIKNALLTPAAYAFLESFKDLYSSL